MSILKKERDILTLVKIFITIIAIMILGDILLTPNIVLIVSAICVAIGTFIVVPIYAVIKQEIPYLKQRFQIYLITELLKDYKNTNNTEILKKIKLKIIEIKSFLY